MSDDALEKAAGELYDHADGDARRLAMIAAQFRREAAGRTPADPLSVLGIVSFQTGQPFVHLRWGENVGQLTPDEARQHALLILEAAQNAVADAAITGWAKDELELDPERAAQLLDAHRRYRADRWGQPDLDLEFGHQAPEEDG